MKRINFNIKDRKVLYGILCIAFISVFTLTVAYAALSTVLNINGSAQVSSANWDIHLDNVKVTNGSVDGDAPRITSATTATFSTILNMPGDFYEFTIDVVNDGSIDAMIENITKTPTLTASQAKYLKYEITYQNGETITTKQLVERNSFVRLKVRLEYRNDISSSDLPSSSETLNLGLQLDYTQSDNSGSVVSGNGRILPVANGNIEDIGTIVTIGSEKFYTIGTEGNNVKLLAMYNLHVGNRVDENLVATPLASPTGKQSELAIGLIFDDDSNGLYPFIGTTPFYDDVYHGLVNSDYSGSLVEFYVNNYKLELEKNVEIVSARLITTDELVDTFKCNTVMDECMSSPYSWIYSTSYWTQSSFDEESVKFIYSDGIFSHDVYADTNDCFGVRPVILISKDYFPKEAINFTIGGVSYQAEDGMTWGEWVESEYNTGDFEKETVNNLVVNKDGYNISMVVLSDVIVSGKSYAISVSRPPE